jgi:ABC-type transport system substrate-binding protein
VTRFTEETLYRYDAQLNPIPYLAASPCDVAANGLDITCRLVQATFHDGATMTADDVAYSFELRRRSTCSGSSTPCLGDALASVTAVDPTTVRFTLLHINPEFFTTDLESVGIEERSAVEASFQRFDTAATAVGAARLKALVDVATRDGNATPPDCHTHLPEIHAVGQQLGVVLDPAEYLGADGTVDPCQQLSGDAQALATAQLALASSGLDRVAAAYPVLDLGRHPSGTGAWQLSSYVPGHELVLTAYPGYRLGPPKIATVRLTFDVNRGPAYQVAKAEAVDWLPGIGPGALAAAQRDPGYRVVTYPAFAFIALQYNVRPGHLFADRRLRQALAMCIDKPRIVQAAEGSLGTTIWSSVLPGSWAYEPNVPQVTRDVPAARALIESAGWKIGADGIFAKGGLRLAAPIVVRADDPFRVHFVDLLVEQARDCGMDMTTEPEQFNDLLTMVDTWPHVDPGTGEPFDLYMGGFGLSFDPQDSIKEFSTADASSASHTGFNNGFDNYTGYSNPQVDRLIQEADATYDQRARARIYRSLQLLLAEDQPCLFAYALTWIELVPAGLTSAAGPPLDFTSPRWYWDVQDLEVTRTP